MLQVGAAVGLSLLWNFSQAEDQRGRAVCRNCQGNQYHDPPPAQEQRLLYRVMSGLLDVNGTLRLVQSDFESFDWLKLFWSFLISSKLPLSFLIGSRAHGYKNCFFRVVKLVVFTAPFLHGSQITWNLNFLTWTCFGFHTGLELYFSFRTITFE